MSSLFSGCSSLTSIDLSYINIDSLTNMNSMFKNCTSLEYIKFPNFNSKEPTV